MISNIFRIIGIAALFVSIIVAALAGLQAAAWKIDIGTVLPLLWTISPYICLFLVGAAVRRFAPTLKMSLAICVISVLMLGFTLFAYVGGFLKYGYIDPFLFLFIPLALYIGGIVLLGISFILAALLSKSPKAANV